MFDDLLRLAFSATRQNTDAFKYGRAAASVDATATYLTKMVATAKRYHVISSVLCRIRSFPLQECHLGAQSVEILDSARHVDGRSYSCRQAGWFAKRLPRIPPLANFSIRFVIHTPPHFKQHERSEPNTRIAPTHNNPSGVHSCLKFSEIT